jgi:hypothetical protein
MTEYTFEEGNWAGAEVWRWEDGEGEMIGRAVIESESGASVRFFVRLDGDRKVSPIFTDQDRALAWVAETVR